MADPVDASRKVKERLITHFLETPKGRRKLAASMKHPLDIRIGWNVLWRKVLDRAETPFCEPHVVEAQFEIGDPNNIDFLERGQEMMRAQLVTDIDSCLISELKQAEPRVVRYPADGFSFPALLEEHREFAKQPGVILLNARVYADIRKFCRDQIEPEGQREHLLIGRMADFEQMAFYWSRLVDPPYDIFFVPKDVGRYTDTLTVESVEPPDGTTPPDWNPRFRCEMEVCLEVDPSKIKRVTIEY